MNKYASGGPTGYIFRAKARGFNALKTETWEKGRHTFDRMPPHVSVTSHGAQVASQHCPILQAGDRMIPWCHEITRGTGINVSNGRLVGRLNHETRERSFHLRNPVSWFKIGGRRSHRFEHYAMQRMEVEDEN